MGTVINEKLMELISCMSDDQQQALADELEKAMSQDNRKHARKAYVTEVVYTTHEKLYHDPTQDISTGGLFIETSEPFAVGQKIALVLSLPNYQNPIKIIGEIARTTESGIGVKFKTATPYIQARIRSIVDSVQS